MPKPNYTDLFVSAVKRNADNPKWEKGAYIGIKTVSNTKVGSIGQDFIESLCAYLNIHCNFPVGINKARANQSPWDIEIGGIKFELKTATEDTNGNFQFNHLRYHRPYDAVLCLGVTPNELFFGIWSKADIVTGKAGKLVTMEKGANASYKLTKRPDILIPISEFEETIIKFTESYIF